MEKESLIFIMLKKATILVILGLVIAIPVHSSCLDEFCQLICPLAYGFEEYGSMAGFSPWYVSGTDLKPKNTNWGINITTSTTTRATSTNFAVSSLNAASCDVKAYTNGSLYCGTDASGGGGGALGWSYDDDKDLLYTATATTPTLIGGTATTGDDIFEVIGASLFDWAEFSGTVTTTDGFYSSASSSVQGDFRVDGNATNTGALYIENDLTVNSGSVGIGTTSPITPLHVDSSSNQTPTAFFSDSVIAVDSASDIQISGSDSVLTIGALNDDYNYLLGYINQGIGKVANYINDDNELFFEIYDIADNQKGTIAFLKQGGFYFFDWVNGGNDWLGLYPYTGDYIAIGGEASNDNFYTAASNTPTIIFDTSNNFVGIGTTTPDSKLTVVGGTIHSSSTADQLRLTYDLESSKYADFNLDSNGDLEIDLSASNSTTTFPDNVRIDGDLRVNGNIQATSTLDYWFDNTGGITGNSNIVTVGTITTGVWNGTAIDASDYTNLTVSAPITLTDDDIGLDLTASYSWTGAHDWNTQAIYTGGIRSNEIMATSTYFDNATTVDSLYVGGIADITGNLEATTITEGGIAVHNNDEMDTSSELAAIIDDETGTGSIVFGTIPSLTGFISTASSTIDSDLNITGNTTSTNATSTFQYVSNSLTVADKIQYSTAGDNYLYFDNATTNYLMWDDSEDHFALSNDLQITGSASSTEYMSIGGDDNSDDDYLYFDMRDEYLLWDNTQGQFEITDDFEVQGVASSTTEFRLNDVFTVDSSGNSTSTGDVVVGDDGGTATTTIVVGTTAMTAKGSCLVLRDHDGGGFTYCVVLDGTMTCSTNDCQ